MAGLRGVRLHANLGVTRVQVSFADFLWDRLHSVLAYLAHAAHLCAIIEGACLSNRGSHVLLWTLNWCALRVRLLAWCQHLARDLSDSVHLSKSSVFLELWEVVVEALEAIIWAD